MEIPISSEKQKTGEFVLAGQMLQKMGGGGCGLGKNDEQFQLGLGKRKAQIIRGPAI